MNELALFAGAGGGILGGHLLGWTTVCAVEWEPYPTSVLITRQNDGILPPFPIWDDVRTFDGRPWRGRVDVVSGGFPCQDISAAGKGAGIDGERSGMWHHMARIIGEVRPRYVFVENSPILTSRGLGRVLGDLAALGYDAEWGVLGAVDAGAPHKRDRIWIVGTFADSTGLDRDQRRAKSAGQLRASGLANGGDDLAYAIGQQADGQRGADQCGRFALGRTEQATLGQDGQAGADCSAGCCASMADASGEGQQGSHQPRALRDEWDRSQAHGPTGECGGVPGSTVAYPLRSGSLPATQAGIHSSETGAGPRDEQFERCGSASVDVRHPASSGLSLGVNGPLGQPGADAQSQRPYWWATEPDVGRVAHGVAARVDRLKSIGNGQVPAVAALAWKTIISRLES